MCIVALAWQVVDEYPICLISNRDEFYARPTARLAAWQDQPILAGRDLELGGTWMGVTPNGRWAVLTNFRNGHDQQQYPTSRGHLVTDFLNSDLTPIRFAKQLENMQRDYAGFNLICGDQNQAVYMSNRGEAPQVLAKGVYVVSNGLMGEHWEKTRHLRKRFTQELLPLLQQSERHAIEACVWDILEDQRKILPALLPQTGITAELEQLLSSTFIQSPNYGTRCSNLLTVQNQRGIGWKKTSLLKIWRKLCIFPKK
jgi:uncharacterized protein with NRDE domain